MSAGAERLAGRLTTLTAFAFVVFLAGFAFDTSLTQVGAEKHIIVNDRNPVAPFGDQGEFGRGLFCATGGAK
jgi:hypothetical protein